MMKFGWIVQSSDMVSRFSESRMFDIRDMNTARIEEVTRIYHDIYAALGHCCILTEPSTEINLCLVMGTAIDRDVNHKKKSLVEQEDNIYPLRVRITSVDFTEIVIKMYHEMMASAPVVTPALEIDDKWSKEWRYSMEIDAYVNFWSAWMFEKEKYALLMTHLRHIPWVDDRDTEQKLTRLIWQAVLKKPEFYTGLIRAGLRVLKWKLNRIGWMKRIR